MSNENRVVLSCLDGFAVVFITHAELCQLPGEAQLLCSQLLTIQPDGHNNAGPQNNESR